ncbi:MAG TPA: PxKF domain-containing protein [Dongiaceae bacterium]|nr:PxKF domain-containing protein [Dongiaceae bacterium]
MPRGTHFVTEASDALAAAVESDRIVDLWMHATPRSIQMVFSPLGADGSVAEGDGSEIVGAPTGPGNTAGHGLAANAMHHVTIAGLTPESAYYLYFDDLQNVEMITADAEGKHAFDIELAHPRLVILQANPSTFHLRADGSGCTVIGVFNPATLTCTLNRDVRQSIEIEDDGMTLDGSGFTLDGTGPLFGAAGVFVRGRKNVTVRNVVIDRADTGVTVSGTSDSLFENITIQNGSGGFMELFETPGADTGRNIFRNNEVSVVCPPGVPCGFGLQGIFNNESTVTGNHFVDTKFGVTSLFSVKMTIEGNSFEDNPTGISVTSSLSPVTVTDNDITGSSVGITISAAINCSITGNYVDGSTEVGLRLPSLSCDVTDNTFANGTLGLDLSGSQMTLFHNRFVSNATQAILGPNANNNSFFGASPIGGNFWSDFDEDAEGCLDGNADGFCDDPYLLNLGADPQPWAADIGWLDGIPPTTTASFQGTAGNAGWYRSNVAVSLSAEDNPGGTGVLRSEFNLDGGSFNPALSPLTLAGDGASTLGLRSIDRAGNVETTQSSLVKIDTAPPSIHANAAPPANAAGWNKDDVTVSFTCADATSSVESCPGDAQVSDEGSAQQVPGTATDVAGNSATTSMSVSIDKTVPGISASLVSPPNAAGWHHAAVDVHFTCSDALSGIASCTDDQHLASEGSGQEASGTAVDNAGNSSSATLGNISIDLTPPTIAAAAVQAANAAGWHHAAVDVHFACSDALSGIADCPADAQVLTEGSAQPVTGTATDVAGNSASATTNVSLDTTAPAVGFSGGCGTTAKLNQSLSTTVLVADALSGVASQSIANGPIALPTGTFGPASLTVLATDLADNPASATCNYRVGYDFEGAGGFHAPVNDPPVLNIAKAGSTIPVKWQLPNGLGGFLSDLSIVLSIQAQAVSCNQFDETLSDPIETTTTDPSGLRFDADAREYHYNWKTLSLWAGKCFVLQLNLDDLSTHTALVKFKN